MQWTLKGKASLAVVMTRESRNEGVSSREEDAVKKKKTLSHEHHQPKGSTHFHEFYSVSDPGTLGLAGPGVELGGVPMSWPATGRGVAIPG
jgi:hypothetical protein